MEGNRFECWKAYDVGDKKDVLTWKGSALGVVVKRSRNRAAAQIPTNNRNHTIDDCFQPEQ